MIFSRFIFIATLTASAASAISIQRRAKITDFDKSPVAFAFPPPRGFSASRAADTPCGGFDPVNRTDYPMSNGEIALVQRTEAANVNILWTKEPDPKMFHSFSTYSSSILEVGPGHFCQGAPDFSSLGFSEGDNATLLVIYQLPGSGVYYYQCADVSLVSAANFTTDVHYVCGNYTSELEIASPEESLHLGNDTSAPKNTTGSSGYTGTASTSSGSTNPHLSGSLLDSKLSAASGGGIGASVTIFVVAVLAGLLWWSGLIHFGRKKQAAVLDHESVSSGVATKERV
ncbi:cytokine inducing-glycoprotein, putative [Cryptococcus gattii WM276]|uniref:Cytokine inducing-glycoprotein, putative n=1 Tax=Cryptococcus gattii serotype B (strain WM276 / ATCC MYA-4071) TaxID=367775 RepID=E6R316_CRYGW|nr:cytokine inducing-glycoprotein, putative [Cryptococcus gattii WM276]ADV20907.1 cytokine inducing-glycoprotein, putative [Cryptococcus gattii WM276]KJE01628.1 cytokine inducing-glycoprotein [Cryptococcus gattii NT-10]